MKVYGKLIAAAGLAIAIIAGFFYWQYEKTHISTDDAYVNANIIQIAPQVSGPVSAIYAQDHQVVKKGQLLFTIDQRPFVIALKKATATLANTEQEIKAATNAVNTAQDLVQQRSSEQKLAQKNFDRIISLVTKGVYSKSQGDDATNQLKVSNAALKAAQDQLQKALSERGKMGKQNAKLRLAKANVAEAKLNLSYTKIISPADGALVNFTLRKGAIITQQEPLFALIENKRWWVDANFKETDIEKIKTQQIAKVKLDMYPDVTFKGIVQSISSGSGSAFSLLPPEDATGNWIKVTQRFPVKILIENNKQNYPLRVGASCTVNIKIN
ncbi:MAG: HlyD family secretion protein [Gammaproteobacteria bacterium]|nr:HlyD family secretion protein [Gammaproteobacteria bacterium]